MLLSYVSAVKLIVLDGDKICYYPKMVPVNYIFLTFGIYMAFFGAQHAVSFPENQNTGSCNHLNSRFASQRARTSTPISMRKVTKNSPNGTLKKKKILTSKELDELLSEVEEARIFFPDAESYFDRIKQHPLEKTPEIFKNEYYSSVAPAIEVFFSINIGSGPKWMTLVLIGKEGGTHESLTYRWSKISEAWGDFYDYHRDGLVICNKLDTETHLNIRILFHPNSRTLGIEEAWKLAEGHELFEVNALQ